MHTNISQKFSVLHSLTAECRFQQNEPAKTNQFAFIAYPNNIIYMTCIYLTKVDYPKVK
jgi:hypothetical protein